MMGEELDELEASDESDSRRDEVCSGVRGSELPEAEPEVDELEPERLSRLGGVLIGRAGTVKCSGCDMRLELEDEGDDEEKGKGVPGRL